VHPVLEQGFPVAFIPPEQVVSIGADLRQSAGLVDNAEHETTRVALFFAACVDGHFLPFVPR
jgi:hypothetical protein